MLADQPPYLKFVETGKYPLTDKTEAIIRTVIDDFRQVQLAEQWLHVAQDLSRLPRQILCVSN